MSAMVMRNLRVFFRDRTSVFFSLLSVFIIIGLYALFLGDMMLSGMPDTPGARFLGDSWIMAGLLAVTSITTTSGAFGTMVEDRTRKTLKDFSASPLSRRALAGGYILSAYIVGVAMSVATLILAEIYIVLFGGALLPFSAMLRALGCILLATLSGSALMFFVVTLIRTQSAYATASTIIGTLIGFLTGIYIPIGSLPEAVQMVIRIFPPSHAGALFRQILTEAPMQTVFEGAPQAAVDAFSTEMGITFAFGDFTVTWWQSVVYLLAVAVLFYGLAVFRLSRKGR